MNLAEDCGISYQYLSMIERGVRPEVSRPVYDRICMALGVGPRALRMAKPRDEAA